MRCKACGLLSVTPKAKDGLCSICRRTKARPRTAEARLWRWFSGCNTPIRMDTRDWNRLLRLVKAIRWETVAGRPPGARVVSCGHMAINARTGTCFQCGLPEPASSRNDAPRPEPSITTDEMREAEAAGAGPALRDLLRNRPDAPREPWAGGTVQFGPLAVGDIVRPKAKPAYDAPGTWTQNHHDAQAWLRDNVGWGHAAGLKVDSLARLLQAAREDALTIGTETAPTKPLAVGDGVSIPGTVVDVFGDGTVRVRFAALGSNRFHMLIEESELRTSGEQRLRSRR